MQPDDRFINIEFSLLNFTNSRYTTYYWRIDGIDTGWNVQKDRNIRLSKLPYGSWNLHIMAQTANGIWSKNELEIKIDVFKPFYLRPWFITLLIIMSGSLSFAGYKWRIRFLEKENQMLDKAVKEKTSDLTESLQQKEILLKEIHHRVKNNLQIISSLLRLQSGSVNDQETKNVLKECQNRVLTIALIHQKLYQNEGIKYVEMGKFSSELFMHLKKVFHNPEIHVRLINKITIADFNIDIAVPIGLILNELITNSFKYAFEETSSPFIRLELEKKGEEYLLTYFDNGKGLPPEINFEKSNTLGLKLVSRLSEQLGGHARYFYHNGSNFEITFRV